MSASASVSLDRVWITNGADPSDSRSWWSERPDDSAERGGEVRTMAGGRRRVISKAGDARTIDVTLHLVTADDEDWLRSLRGSTVLYRDQKGRRMWGVFFGLDVEDYRDGDADVSLTIASVTVTEGV